MPRVNIREVDPIHYAKVRAEQEKLQAQCDSTMMVARLCPYCSHKIEVLCRGTHSGAIAKCSNCGEKVFFPPISFRLAR